MGVRRGRVFVLAGATVLLGSGVAVAALAVPRGPDEATRPVVMETYNDRDGYGIRFGMQTSFDEDVTLSAATLMAGGDVSDAQLWPLDGQDHESEDLSKATLRAGTTVLVDGWVKPSCRGDATDEARFRLRAEGVDGHVVIISFPARNPEILAPALKRWCAQGPTIGLSHTQLQPDGTAIVYLANPGPKSIRVEAPAYADAHASWESVTASVAGGQAVDIEVHGTNVDCDDGETGSWDKGRLLVDGHPVVIHSDDSHCG